MKSFRYKFTVIIWVLIALVLAISLTGVGFNVFNLATTSGYRNGSVAVTIIILIINILICAFAISVMVFSKYVIKKDCVYCFFGFIPSKLKINDITEITHFKKNNKLVAYFTDQRYTVIVISPEKYDDFVKTIREVNANIIFDTQNEEK